MVVICESYPQVRYAVSLLKNNPGSAMFTTSRQMKTRLLIRCFLLAILIVGLIVPLQPAWEAKAAPDTLGIYFVYLTRYPSEAQIQKLEKHGTIVYLDSWIPPLNSHLYGFLTAQIKPSKLDKIAKLDFVIRVVPASTSWMPQ